MLAVEDFGGHLLVLAVHLFAHRRAGLVVPVQHPVGDVARIGGEALLAAGVDVHFVDVGGEQPALVAQHQHMAVVLAQAVDHPGVAGDELHPAARLGELLGAGAVGIHRIEGVGFVAVGLHRKDQPVVAGPLIAAHVVFGEAGHRAALVGGAVDHHQVATPLVGGDGRQVLAVGGEGHPGELVVLEKDLHGQLFGRQGGRAQGKQEKEKQGFQMCHFCNILCFTVGACYGYATRGVGSPIFSGPGMGQLLQKGRTWLCQL